MTAFRLRVAALCLAGIALTFPVAAQQAEQAQQPQQPQVAPAPGVQAQPQDVLKATHGDWEIRCIQGTEVCAMQQIGKTAEGQRALQVTVERLAGVTSEGQPVPAALTVRTPLGVLIPYMVRLKVDDGNVEQIPLLRCLPDSCVARAPMMEQQVQQLKRGASATFGFFLTDEVLVDVSLNGFTAAYNELEPIEAQDPAQN